LQKEKLGSSKTTTHSLCISNPTTPRSLQHADTANNNNPKTETKKSSQNPLSPSPTTHHTPKKEAHYNRDPREKTVKEEENTAGRGGGGGGARGTRGASG
jgi:hypothetical protein